MMRLILGVAAALFLTAGQAAADGLPSKGRVKAAEPAFNWNGFYVGLGIGAGAVVHDLSASAIYNDGYEGTSVPIAALGFDGIGGEGVFGTITVGYDRVIRPGWVAGVFADYDFGSNISTDVSLSIFNLQGSASLDHEYSWAIGGRLGFLTNPGTLVYGTAGYTQAEFDYFGLLSKTYGGYFVGAGIESFLRDNWTLKLEYRFSQFDAETLASGSSGHLGFSIEDEPSMHTARLVLSYKFGYH
jgi:outer membrane immunogenic protein